jgi:hypothetical protein
MDLIVVSISVSQITDATEHKSAYGPFIALLWRTVYSKSFAYFLLGFLVLLLKCKFFLYWYQSLIGHIICKYFSHFVACLNKIFLIISGKGK